MRGKKPALHLRRLGIHTYNEAILYLRQDCYICHSEGFEVHARVRVTLGDRAIIATIQLIHTEILCKGEAGLSEYAWHLLAAKEGDEIQVLHAPPLTSLSDVRAKIYGHPLGHPQLNQIIQDITAGRYSDIQISAFLTACAGDRMNGAEILALTQAMLGAGDCLKWDANLVVDKHSVGGLPGNRTTPIIVPIVTAFGLMMPKTSSRAITSPSGTADTMETLAPVEMDLAAIRRVVGQEGGCIVWGGSVALSPADDILIRVEKSLDLDSEGQLVASVLSKKIAAGSTHVLIDMPIGPTAKVRSEKMGELLKHYFEQVAAAMGIGIKVLLTDGTQPVGRGIGPALEARDVVAVLKREPDAPKDLRERALLLAGHVLEFSPQVKEGTGIELAREILDSGQAWQKFQSICQAQGGMREIPLSQFTQGYPAKQTGRIQSMDNRKISLLAKLAGAPDAKTAGIELLCHVGDVVQEGQPLFNIHAGAEGEMEYVLAYLSGGNEVVQIEN